MGDTPINNIESAPQTYVPNNEQRSERRASLSDEDVQTRWALYHDDKHEAPVLARFVSPSETALTTDFADFISPARKAVVRKASETTEQPVWLGKWMVGVDIVTVVDYDVNKTVPLDEEGLTSMYNVDAETLKRDFERVTGTVREAPHAPEHLQSQWGHLVTAVREFSAAFNSYFTRTTVRNVGMTVVEYGHEFDAVYTNKLTASIQNIYQSNQARQEDIEGMVIDALINEDLAPLPMFRFLALYTETIEPQTRRNPTIIDTIIQRHERLLQSQHFQEALDKRQQTQYRRFVDALAQPTDEQDDQDRAPDN